MMFDTYTTEVELKGEKYTLRPLTGRFIGKLYSVVTKLQPKEGEDENDITNKLDEDTMSKFYDIALETFKASYPKEDEEKIKGFVAQNLIALIEPIVTVNIGKLENKEKQD